VVGAEVFEGKYSKVREMGEGKWIEELKLERETEAEGGKWEKSMFVRLVLRFGSGDKVDYIFS